MLTETGGATMRLDMQMQESQTDMQTLEGRIGGIETKLDTLNTSVLTLQGSIMSRAEVYAEDQKRVSLERFEGETNGIRERLNRLEGGPQKLLAWLGAGIGCVSMLIAAAGTCAAIVGTLAAIIFALIPFLAR